jgi:ornithine cyclodeaminase/alanine dehydrogenase
LAGEVPTIRRCQVYDIVPERQSAYVDEMNQRYDEIEVVGCDSAESAVRGADIVIPGGSITEERNATITSDWIKPGALIVTIDYDSYVTDECIDAMDIVMTDDYAQIEDARKNERKFLGVTRIDADNAELISERKGRRSDDSERIIAFNLGIALEDLATAAVILDLARSKNAGVELMP